jgi:hypothetical protein
MGKMTIHAELEENIPLSKYKYKWEIVLKFTLKKQVGRPQT